MVKRLFLFTGLLLGACSPLQLLTVSSDTKVGIQVKWPDSELAFGIQQAATYTEMQQRGIQTIRLTLTDSVRTHEQSVPFSSRRASFSNVAPGAISVTLRCLDSSGQILFWGTQDDVITRGSSKNLQVNMYRLSPSVHSQQPEPGLVEGNSTMPSNSSPTPQSTPYPTPDPLERIAALEFTFENRFFNKIGEVRQLTFRALDISGQAVVIHPGQLEWRSSRPQDILVTQNGEATAIGDYGYSEITIKVPGRDVQATLRMSVSDGRPDATGANPLLSNPTQDPSTAKIGQSALDAVLKNINDSQFVSFTASTVERNMDSGKISSKKIKLSAKSPNIVKIDVLESSSGSAGIKALYTSGQGNKINVRPSGSLSFTTVELDKTDERVASNNGYLLDDTDLFGFYSRLSKDYTADWVGITYVEGVRVNLLKLTTTGPNALDSRIEYEHIAYEPNTYKVRLWELYAQGEREPYYRMTFQEISYPDFIPDSAFDL